MRKSVSMVAACIAAIALFPAHSDAQGLTFVVTSTGDGADASPGNGICATGGGGACTLRAAIQEANALAGPDTIQFAIGSGVQTITVGSALPTITSPVTLDGTTQPGFSSSPIIVIDGNGVSGGVRVSAGNSTVRGLVIVKFSGDGLTLLNNGNNVVEMNYLGIGADGSTDAGNSGFGIVVDHSPGNRIGGPSATQRNVIGSNKGKGGGGGIVLESSDGQVIQGNYIGVDATGMLERANEARGIAIIGSSNNLIGGPGDGMGNLIAGNRATAVRMLGGSSNNIVQRNFIGVNRTATAFIANDRGVQIRGGSGHQIIQNLIAGQTYDGVLIWDGSTDNLVSGNIIAYNGWGPVGDATEAGYNGVWIAEGTGNRIVSNQIFGNALQGISLGIPQRITPNDVGDADTGANELQNFPVLTSVTRSGGSTRIVGTLNSTANGTFLIQFFSDANCGIASNGHGAGRYPLGEVNVNTNGSGNASFDVLLGVALPVNWVVSATATDSQGNTSEFSACGTVQ